eukprot:4734452-Heterocapsa_arctica.AAC.1
MLPLHESYPYDHDGPTLHPRCRQSPSVRCSWQTAVGGARASATQPSNHGGGRCLAAHWAISFT